jgi:carbon monoxide dehydrogenase subunit G
MKLSSKQDIEAPIAKVWALMTDFDAWETAAMRRGAEVARTDMPMKSGIGKSWQAKFAYRGRARVVDVTLSTMNPPNQIGFAALASAIEVASHIELIEMSAKRTRVHVTVEVKPRTLGARLFLQSLRLARAKVDRRFDKRILAFATDIEQRAKGTSGARA